MRAAADEVFAEILAYPGADGRAYHTESGRLPHRYSYGTSSSSRQMLHHPAWAMLTVRAPSRNSASIDLCQQPAAPASNLQHILTPDAPRRSARCSVVVMVRLYCRSWRRAARSSTRSTTARPASPSGRSGNKTVFFSHFYIKMIILPRQARDKHRKSTQKRNVLLQRRGRGHGTTGCGRVPGPPQGQRTA